MKFVIFIFVYLMAASALAQETYSKLAQSAFELTKADVQYDPSYFSIEYPNGDVPSNRGVCTDVVIRSYRAMGIDLQKLVHEDMKANFAAYPHNWGLTRTDTNIDHRRVPNLQVFLTRKGQSLKVTYIANDYQPGDIVSWNLNPDGHLDHIGIVSEHRAQNGVPLIIHNIGSGQNEDDILFRFEITGHYRYMPEASIE